MACFLQVVVWSTRSSKQVMHGKKVKQDEARGIICFVVCLLFSHTRAQTEVHLLQVAYFRVAIRAQVQKQLACAQARAELQADVAQLRERLGLEESSTQRLRHTEEQAHSALHGELSRLQSSFGGDVLRLQEALQMAQSTLQEMTQQLASERQQRAAEGMAVAQRIAHAQQRADGQIRCERRRHHAGTTMLTVSPALWGPAAIDMRLRHLTRFAAQLQLRLIRQQARARGGDGAAGRKDARAGVPAAARGKRSGQGRRAQ